MDNNYDGKLTRAELLTLIRAGMNVKQIKKIEDFLIKHKDYLTGLSDLTGDRCIPGSLFNFNTKHFGYLLSNDPEKVLSQKGVNGSKYVFKLIQKFGPLISKSSIIMENRNELLNIKDENGNFKKDKGIVLPDEPVIWAPNHHYKDDVLASVVAAKRPFYIMFGSLPQFYNTFDGVLSYLSGSIIINRKLPESKQASLEKAKRALEYNTDLLLYPEGVWDKMPEKLLLDLWHGIYKIAKENNTMIVPIVHYIRDITQTEGKKENPIHIVVDDPIDIFSLGEDEGLEKLRETMATWYYLMMEKYGKSTRKELVEGFENSTEAWENHLEKLTGKVEMYDSSIETNAYYTKNEIVTPCSVYEDVANLDIDKDNALTVDYARKLVKTEKRRNFQQRF